MTQHRNQNPLKPIRVRQFPPRQDQVGLNQCQNQDRVGLKQYQNQDRVGLKQYQNQDRVGPNQMQMKINFYNPTQATGF